MNKKIKLTGSQLNDLVKESVTRILKEDSSNEDDERKWAFLADELDANEFINDIYNILDEGTIHSIIENMFEMYEIGDDYADNYDDEDYEYVQDFRNWQNK